MIPTLVIGAYLCCGVAACRIWAKYTEPRSDWYGYRVTREPGDYALCILFWPLYAIGGVIKLVLYGLALLGGYEE